MSDDLRNIFLFIILTEMLLFFGSLGIPIFIWLKFAEWVNLDLFTLYAALNIEECYQWEATPGWFIFCREMAIIDFEIWIESKSIWSGVALIFEFLGDLWLGWHILALIFVTIFLAAALA